MFQKHNTGQSGSRLLHLIGDLRPLHVAAFVGNEIILEFLTTKFCDEIENGDVDGDRAIHYAAIADSYKSIQILLAKRAEINARNNAGQLNVKINKNAALLRRLNYVLTWKYKGKTALHLAVKRENVVSVRHLLESGAASSLRDCDGETPLHYAIFGHRDDIVSILIRVLKSFFQLLF